MHTITRSTSPRSSCRRWRCEYCTHQPSSRYLYGNSLFTPWKTLYQDDNIGRCAGFHLRDLRHVLRASEFCRLPHPGESEQSQTHAVHQRSAAVPLLAGQLCLGHGKRWRLHCQHRREFHNLVFKSPETIFPSCRVSPVVQLHCSGYAGHHHLCVFPTRGLRLLHEPARPGSAAAALRVPLQSSLCFTISPFGLIPSPSHPNCVFFQVVHHPSDVPGLILL